MTEIELRLELLKLTYTHGRTSAEAVDRAKTMEEWLKEGSPVERPVATGKDTLHLPPKKSNNPFKRAD